MTRFEPADTTENRRRIEEGQEDECLLAYRTKGEYWGKERTVIVTHTPASARKQAYTFADKLEAMRQELLAMRAKVRDKAPHWRNEEAVRERYIRFCEHIHMTPQLYELEFAQSPDGLSLTFRKNVYLVSRKQAMFGKNIIITDNTDWLTGDIIEASLARWQVEDRFRLSKDDDLVGTSPVRHWTDSKIRCHLFTCVVAMTYLRRIELKMAAAGQKRSIEEIMDDMRHLHYVLSVKKKYLIKLSLMKLSFGQVFGEGAEGQELEVTLNGQRVKLYKLDEVPMFFMKAKPGSTPGSTQALPRLPSRSPIRWPERVKMTPDIHLEFKLNVKAGPQTVGVAFLQKSYEANEDLVHRPGASTFDPNIGMQYGYDTVPHLARVDITGPYHATGPGDTPSRRRIFVCHPTAPADEIPCARQILSHLVRRAFRRAPSDSDLESLLSFYQQERNKTGSFEAGIEIALRRILADPEFVFRFEPPPANVAPGERYRISDTELASRLSFFLWCSIPDDELLRVAIQGKLHDPAVLSARRGGCWPTNGPAHW